MLAILQYFPVAALFLCLGIFSKLHFSAAKPSGFSIKIIPRDSPESPLYPGNLTQLERIERLVRFNNAKVDLVNKIFTSNATTNGEKFFTSVSHDSFYYFGEVILGTPQVFVLLLMDTGGGLIWTQCEPCINCYHQQYPLYNSQASSTYRKLPCDHPFCHGDSSPFRCVNGECVYTLYYGGGSSGPTKGVASLETFTFRVDDTHGVAINDIVFGCSNDNQNFPTFDDNGLISGILGLSLAPDSLFNQLSSQINKRFSYCLPQFSGGVPSSAILRFGDDIPLGPGFLRTTPYFSLPTVYYYFMHLEDISIGFSRLNFPPGTFDIQNRGIFIDSGAPFTNLVTDTPNGVNVYETVMTVFQNHYDSFHLERVPATEAPSQFSLCYRNRADFNAFKSMTFHFAGANYFVAAKYMNINFSEGFFCVAILPTQGMSILGAWHQQNMRIIYDGNLQSIQFFNVDCSVNDRL